MSIHQRRSLKLDSSYPQTQSYGLQPQTKHPAKHSNGTTKGTNQNNIRATMVCLPQNHQHKDNTKNSKSKVVISSSRGSIDIQECRSYSDRRERLNHRNNRDDPRNGSRMRSNNNQPYSIRRTKPTNAKRLVSQSYRKRQSSNYGGYPEDVTCYRWLT